VNEVEQNLLGKIQYLDRRYQRAMHDAHFQAAKRLLSELHQAQSDLNKVRGRSMESLKLENVVIPHSGSIRKRKGYTLVPKGTVEAIVAELRQRVDEFKL